MENLYGMIHQRKTSWETDLEINSEWTYTPSSTTDPAPEGGAVPPPRNKRNKEFTEKDNKNKLADIQAINILSQGLLRRIFNILNQNETGREIWVNFELLLKGSGQTLERRKEALFYEFKHFRANGNKLIQDYFVRFHKLNNMNMSTVMYVELFTHLRTYKEHALKSLKKKEQSSVIVDPLAYLAKTTPTHSTTSPVTILTPQSSGDSHNDAMLATMNQIANLLSGLQKQRAPGNTRTKGIQTTRLGVNNSGKKVIYYNCRGEGHVARQCKEPKRAHDSQWYHDKALLMQAKEKGVVLDAEAKAFLTDVECTAPYDQPLALTTTNLFEANHEDAYDSDEMQQEEHLNYEVDSVLDDNMITYDEYQHDFEVEAVPTVVSADEADKQSMIAVLQRMHTEIAGYVWVNDEHKLVNATLTVELEWCKVEMQALECNKVKHDLDMAIDERNKRNAKLDEENVMLKSTLKSKVVSIEKLQQESKQVLSEKKTLKDKYFEEIVFLTNANKVATNVLKCFQMPTHTIPMLSKRPNFASHDLHKTGLGYSNPRVHDSEESLVHAEVCKIKMAERPGHALPINYAKLNALYDQFVPQKELSQEQVYWLPAVEIASQSSTPAKPVAPFVHTRPVKSDVHKKKKMQIEKKNLLITNECLIENSIANDICSIVLAYDFVVPPSYDSSHYMLEELRTTCNREHSKVLELEAKILKKQQVINDAEKRCAFIQNEHVKLQLKFQKYKECDTSNSTTSNEIFEINKLKEQLQGRDDSIRNLQAQNDIMSLLNVGSTDDSCNKQALETELTQLKDTVTSLKI
uniref:CCHC-type domain-containing protein n=1 Tax=Tanacetum cinerariifolium TaxID=118510 RepID=A0A6L2LYU9_TANCI|nr:hypothetical protein [Tanacetum cinerariifolium]